jgi:hypothetical protein
MPKEADIALAAYRSIPVEIGYVTMPITGGPRCYDVAQEFGCVSTREFIEKHRDVHLSSVVEPNLQDGNEFGRRVQSLSNIPVVVPGMLDANNPASGFEWEEEDFMHLWRGLIRDKIARLHLMKGWQYSNGSTEEFQLIMEKQRKKGNDAVQILDHYYRDVSFGRGCRLIAKAIEDIQGRCMDASGLRRRLKQIMRLQRK